MTRPSFIHDPAQHSVRRSLDLHSRALQIIPGAAQAFSKSASQMAMGVSPLFIMRAEGSRVWDIDGHEYVDYMMGLGPVILGHGFAPVVEAQVDQLRRGQALSLTCPLELEVAEMICQMVPSAEMVKFAKNGSDVTGAAIRLARCATGRDHVAAGGYHGWHDWYIGATEWHGGVPQAVRELTHRFDQRDADTLTALFEQYPDQIAAVIIEPATYSAPPDKTLLETVKQITHRHGALLIFDEVLSGFRTHNNCVQGQTGIVPDLCTLGKAIANGAPLSAVVGRGDLMQRFTKDAFFSFTFGGEAVSLAAGAATLQIIDQQPVCRHITALGERLREGISESTRRHQLDQYIGISGPGPMLAFSFADAPDAEAAVLRTMLIQELARRGVLALGYMVISYSHSDADIDTTLRVHETAFELISDHLRRGTLAQQLEGPPVTPVFRAR